jgi:cell division protein FtsZ
MGVRQITEKPIEESKEDEELRSFLEKRKTMIKVVGVGGAGNNTITRLMQVGITGTETIAVNTDAMDLLYTDAEKKVLIGKEITSGLGVGANPEVGKEAATESKQDIKDFLKGSDMVFITCGLGGGTGTGASPVIADVAKKQGVLTVGIVTMPFTMEGKQRMRNAEDGLTNLEGVVDTLIIIPNDKLLEIVPDVSISTAFKVCDEILVNAVKGIAELVTKPGLVNLDFADIKAVMNEGGLAMIGMGESDTDNRAFESVERALNNPLLSVNIDDARGALVNVMGGPDMTIREAQQIVEAVSSKISSEAKIIWGSALDKSLGDSVKTLLIVTGVKSPQIFGPKKLWTKEKKKDIEKILKVEFVE